MNMSAEALRIDLMIVSLTGGSFGFGVGMFTEVCMIVVRAAVIALKVVVPVSFTIDLRSDVTIDALAGTVIGVAPDIGVHVLACADANMWEATVTALEFIPMLASSEEILLFGCEACSCWPTAACICRALQARMPSLHV